MLAKLDEKIHHTSKNIFKINNRIISNLNNLIIKNNLRFDNDFPSLIEKNYKELSFLNCKRINLNNPEKDTENLPDKENSFNFCLNEKIKNEFDVLKNLTSKNKDRIFYIYKNYSKKKNNNNNNFNPSKIYKIENNNSIFINILFYIIISSKLF